MSEIYLNLSRKYCFWIISKLIQEILLLNYIWIYPGNIVPELHLNLSRKYCSWIISELIPEILFLNNIWTYPGNIVTGNDQQTDAVLQCNALPVFARLLQHPKGNILKVRFFLDFVICVPSVEIHFIALRAFGFFLGNLLIRRLTSFKNESDYIQICMIKMYILICLTHVNPIEWVSFWYLYKKLF